MATSTIDRDASIRPDTLNDVFDRLEGPVFMTGMNALVRAMLVQGSLDRAASLRTAGYVSGYRGSPLGNLDMALVRAKSRLAKADIKFQPGLNEELAATALWGTQQAGLYEKPLFDGVFGVWYGKGPGVDRSGDALKHGNLAGSHPHGGVVVLAGDDHVCKSSTTAHQSEQALIAAGIPVLNPAGVEDIVPFLLAAIAMSRYSGCWVSLKCLTDTMDSSAALLPAAEHTFVRPEFALPEGGLNIRRADNPLAQEARLIDWKLPAARAFAAANGLDRVTLAPARKRLGIVTCGKSWLDVRAALETLGLDERRCADLGIGILKIGMTWPLEADGARAFADGYEEIIVVEEKRSLVEDQLRAALYNVEPTRRPAITGKTDLAGRVLLASHGELDPSAIAMALSSRLLDRGIVDWLPPVQAKAAPGAPAQKRVTWFCSGCPHNTSTKLPAGSTAGAGIGCHGLAAFNDTETTLPFTQMGGEGVNWVGRSAFVETRHVFQNLGDGTYNHSGLLAIRAAVAANVNITYKILFNDAVAMTGGQPHEGTLTVDAIARQVVAEGVKRLVVVAAEPERHFGTVWPAGVTVHHRDELSSLQLELHEIEGVTALIYDQACATELRRRRKRGLVAKPDVAVHINDLVCEGCGDCGAASNCVAIQPLPTPLGQKRRIDQSMCNVDQSCLKGFCPSFVTVESIGAAGGAVKQPLPKAPDVPAPVLAPLADDPYAVLLAGIGGTGIVTISALLGMAAHLDGLQCRIVDQTGMAQKNGAVTSHVILARSATSPLPARIAQGKAELLLGCDMLGAAQAENLALASAGGVAIVNADVTTTGKFTRNPDLDLDVAACRRRIEGRLGQGGVSYLSASSAATRLFGDATPANMMMLGYAWQCGRVPISFAALDRAIELNGVEIAKNRSAFAWGRALAEGADLPGEGKTRDPAERTSSEVIADLRRHLVAYQNEAYARAFDGFVDQVACLERARLGEGASAITLVVARSLHKLMAYKDEYEVARLLADPDQIQSMRSRYPEGAKLHFHLAPPLLARRDERTGHPKKMKFGEGMLPVFRTLARLKGLRGTALDVFGHTAERRQERALIETYKANISKALDRLSADNAARVAELAALPMTVRGFGHVKARAMQVAAERERQLMSHLNADTAKAGAAA